MKLLKTTMKVAMTITLLIAIIGSTNSADAKITYTKDKFELTGGSSNSYVRFNNTNSVFFQNTVQKIYEPIGTNNISAQSENSKSVGGVGDLGQFTTVSLSFNLTGQYPYIYGNDNIIKFYSPGWKTYNTLYAAGFYNLSDQRSKKDINDLEMGLNSILQLRPVSYHWIEVPDSTSVMNSDQG